MSTKSGWRNRASPYLHQPPPHRVALRHQHLFIHPRLFYTSTTLLQRIAALLTNSNNFLVFPGIGFGSIFCDADRITDGMITAAAIGLSRSLTEDEQQHQLLYPRLTRIREVSAEVALAVVRAAQKDGVDQNVALRDLDDDQLLAKIKQTQWSPYEDEIKSNL